MQSEIVYLGLGGNLGDPIARLHTAIECIDALKDTQVLQTSSFYRSAPMGPTDQPDYINAVTKIRTSLSPQTLLESTQNIENLQGRVRTNERWGARTLDIDILLYGTKSVSTEELTIPHYGISTREFVLVPLFEIAQQLLMPDGKPISHWVAQCSLDGLKRISAPQS